MPELTFNFRFDYGDKTWTARCRDFPDIAGVSLDPYDALLECAWAGFELAQRPEEADFEHLRHYTQLNLEFFPYVAPEEREVEIEERELSPEQQERLRRLNFDGI